MARKHSLLAGGSGSASAILKKAPRKPSDDGPLVDISEQALAKRAEQRKVLPQHALVFTRSGHNSRKIEQVTFSFQSLASKYPHHITLLNQLLVGLSSSIPNAVSSKTIRVTYSSPDPFINFLNRDNITAKNVSSIRDIDAFVLQSFRTYLTSNATFSKSTSPRIYTSLKRAITTLKEKYSDDYLIGESTFIPRGPQLNSGSPVEGYNHIQMKELIRCCLKDIKAIKRFHWDYNLLNSSSSQLMVVKNGHNVTWRQDPDGRFKEIQATIKNEWPEYPYYMSLDSAKQLFEGRKLGEQSSLRNRVDKALQNCSGKISFMNGELGRGAIFAAQHFVPDTIFPFLLLVQIATGFNAECVKFMPDNMEEFVGDDILDPVNYAILYGYKARTDTIIPVRCKKIQANGAYNLLKYVASTITKYKDSEHYVKGTLFQYTRVKLATRNDNEGLICSFHGSSNRFSRMGQAFVKRHALEELIGTTVDAKKVRSGFATLLSEGGVTTSRIAEHLGHNNTQEIPETADKHYLSDAASVAIKNKALRDIQNNFVSDITNYRTRVVSSKTLQQMRDAINSAKDESERSNRILEAAKELMLEEKAIVHLLDLGAQTYILACEDMTSPTWPGHENFVKNDQCRQYNKCCMCRQAVVFPEALPYIAKRIIDVEELQSTMTAIEWVTNFGDEREAWRNILLNWNNEQQVEIAWKAAESGQILLPKVMRGGSR